MQRNIHIDNYEVDGDIITAYTLIDEKDIDFSINRETFETWCDEHEMREWERDREGGEDSITHAIHGVHAWSDIYDGWKVMEFLLKAYIQHLYDMEAMDIESVIKKIANP